jgi:cellulose synthase operon protein C
MVELAFLVGSHLAYHVGAHRLLLYFPSMDELSACFLAAVKVVRPAVSVPPALEDAVAALAPLIAERLTEEERDQLALAVIELHEAGAPADLSHWTGAVERCAARSGYLLSGDLAVAASSLASAEVPGVLSAEEKIGDLLSFTVGEAFHILRQELGVAIDP